MKYLLILLCLSCSPQRTIFDQRIAEAKKWQRFASRYKNTAIVRIPLQVRCGWPADTVRLMPGYGTKGYVYKVAIINDTLRIVDSVKQ